MRGLSIDCQADVMESRPPGEITAQPVVLRRYRGDELPPLLEAVNASVEHLRPWMPWAVADPLDAGLSRFIASSVEQFDRAENFSYAIWDEEPGKPNASMGPCHRPMEASEVW